ncbi:MAG: hypothetical protein VKP70_00285, partial [Cyanobacteriota bacterium]|nr:hypothetical protein [Cyanobacteriota bacterium]
LNWRRDPGYEQRMNENRLAIEQSKERTKQLEKDTELIGKDTELIEKEIEQLRQENARERALSALIKQHCFPPDFSSITQTPTAPDCSLS